MASGAEASGSVPPQKSWSIVQFEKSIGIVPFNWFAKDKISCKFPKVNAYALNTLTENCAVPKEGWLTHKVLRVIKDNIADFSVAKDEYLQSESEVEVNPPVKPTKNRHALPEFPRQNPNVKLTHDEDGDDEMDDGDNGQMLDRNPKTSNAHQSIITPGSQTSSPGTQQPTSHLSSTPGSQKSSNATQQPTSHPSSQPDGHSVNNDFPVMRENDSVEKKLSQILTILSLHHVQLKNIIEALTNANADGKSKQTSNREKKDGNSSQSEDEFLLSNCPFKTPKEFEAFDVQLASSKNLRRKFRKELELHLTKDKTSSCLALAKRIFSDECAQYYTWKGRETSNQECKKNAFESTRMYDIISQTVNKKFENDLLTTAEYQEALADWFTQAKFRIKGKNERKEKRAKLRLEKEKAKEEAAKAALESSSESEDTQAVSANSRKRRRRSSKKKANPTTPAANANPEIPPMLHVDLTQNDKPGPNDKRGPNDKP